MNLTIHPVSLVDDKNVHKKYNKSRWIDKNILCFLLCEISKYTNKNQSILFLDNYSIHTEQIIQKMANALNIKLIFIPANTTPIHQPLDVKINGSVKAIAKHICKEYILENPFSTPKITDSINIMIESLNKIKPSAVQKLFQLACDFIYTSKEPAIF